MVFNTQPTRCQRRHIPPDGIAHASVVTSWCPPFHTPVVFLPGCPLLVSDSAYLRPFHSATTFPLLPAERRCYDALMVTSSNSTAPHVNGSTWRACGAWHGMYMV